MKVFVSSTVNDLETYREEVRRALYQAGIHCHLSEDWVHTYVDTLDIVRQRLAESDTYFGIFAHYYGSVPPKSDESITALEFRWANERPLPMAVFMPEIGGEADRELQHAAEKGC